MSACERAACLCRHRYLMDLVCIAEELEPDANYLHSSAGMHKEPQLHELWNCSAGDQFQSLQKVSGEFATYAARAKHWHRRPKRPPMDKTSTILWWKYAGTSVQEMLPTTMQWTDVQQVRVAATLQALAACRRVLNS